MNSIVIGKIETDPLIHWGGVFNNIYLMFLLFFVWFFLFLPFLREGRYRNFLFFITLIAPSLNIYYRNYHQFVGGVFLGHLLLILGTLLLVYLTYSNFESPNIKTNIFFDKKLLLPLIIILFVVKAVFVFGSRPTDSGIYSGIGGILYLRGSSPFRDYWGVVSIGARYGPMLYFAYLPFVPLAHITKYLLWGDALTPWVSVSDVPLAVATSYTGALFYEGLILYILIKSFKNLGYYAAILYILNPLNCIATSVNANELPQTAFFITAIYFLRNPIFSSLLFVFSSLMKIYPILTSVPFLFSYNSKNKKRFFFFLIIFFIIGFFYWLFEATLAPPELRTNPIRDVLLYQSDPGPYHSLWYFTDVVFGKAITFLILVVICILILFAGVIIYTKKDQHMSLRLSIIVGTILIITNRSIHPGYYYYVHTLLFYLFFASQEESIPQHINN